MKTTHDLIVIGAGAAGLTLASGASQLGMKVVIFEKGKMGGDCLNYGCVPSKSLIKSAGIYSQLEHLKDYGLPRVEPPDVDLKSVMDGVKDIIKQISYHDSVERFNSLGVEVIQEKAEFSSPHIILAGEKFYSAPKIVIATGSSPSVPSVKGLEDIQYLTNETIFNLNEVPSHLITIGGGPIGIELSQAFRRLGARVTVLNRGPHILGKEDEDMALIVEESLKQDGVEIFNNADILETRQIGAEKKILFKARGEEKSLEGDAVLVAAGRRGNGESLNPSAAGLETKNGYFPVDGSLKTRVKGIYAAGDSNGKYLFTHVAGAEGSFLVRRLVLGLPGRMNYRQVPWCTFSDPELASVGYNEKRAVEDGLEYRIVESQLDVTDRALTDRLKSGKIKILIDKKDRVIGTQIAGQRAGELILLSLMAVKKKMKLSEIMTPVFPYPVLGEIQKRAAGSFYAPRLFNSRVRNILKKIYGYRGSYEEII